MRVHLHAAFFLINKQLALCIPGFHICGFSQPRTENNISYKMFYAILHKGLKGSRILVSKGVLKAILRGLGETNVLPIYLQKEKIH